MHVVSAAVTPNEPRRAWNGSPGAATARSEIRLCCSSFARKEEEER